MFKKIKNKLSFKRRMKIEILETLATICLYLEFDGRRNRYGQFMRGHFGNLKELSMELREKEYQRME